HRRVPEQLPPGRNPHRYGAVRGARARARPAAARVGPAGHAVDPAGGPMNPIEQAIIWLNDPLNWTNPGGILDRLREHIVLSAGAVVLGCLIAWPLGVWLGHRRVGGGPV